MDRHIVTYTGRSLARIDEIAEQEVLSREEVVDLVFALGSGLLRSDRGPDATFLAIAPAEVEKVIRKIRRMHRKN
jgi:hypothetical protein